MSNNNVLMQVYLLGNTSLYRFDTKWQQAFAGKNLACAGDDVMSQPELQFCTNFGKKLFVDRGVKIEFETYQLNVGGYGLLQYVYVKNVRG